MQSTNIDRSRFALSTVRAYNTIAKELYPNKDILLPESDDKQQYYVKEITQGDLRSKEKIVTWMLLGMLSNTWNQNEMAQFGYSFNANKMVAMNHSLVQQVQISIENYIVSLCDLDSIYEKVNMEYLGISKEKDDDKFNEIMKEIRESNEEVIEICRKIAVNTDVAMELLDFCSERKNIKDGGTKSELERHIMAGDIFFRNVNDFVEKYLEKESGNIGILNFTYDEGELNIIISHIYAKLLEAAAVENMMSRDEMVKTFNAKLHKRAEEVPELERVSRYFVTKTAKNAEANMSNLASNIQRYYSLHRDEKMNEADVLALCDLYKKIMDIYWENPQNEISDEVNNQYKKLRNKYDKVCQ